MIVLLLTCSHAAAVAEYPILGEHSAPFSFKTLYSPSFEKLLSFSTPVFHFLCIIMAPPPPRWKSKAIFMVRIMPRILCCAAVLSNIESVKKGFNTQLATIHNMFNYLAWNQLEGHIKGRWQPATLDRHWPFCRPPIWGLSMRHFKNNCRYKLAT